MGLFHTHNWKEIARTYSPSWDERGITTIKGYISPAERSGMTTILWKCKDKNCQKTRQDNMLGKLIK